MLTSVAKLHPVTLCFADDNLEAAFRSDCFRGALALHVSHFGMLVVVLAVGLFDPAFHLISRRLMPLGIVELILRLYLHRLSNHRVAQQAGAFAMLVLTTTAWIVYVVATFERAGTAPASLLITAFIALMLMLYPVQLGLFMLSPWQRAWAIVAALAAVSLAPSWSQLNKLEELSLHLFALLAGLGLAYALERMLREAQILKVAAVPCPSHNPVLTRARTLPERQVEAALRDEERIVHRLAEMHQETERKEEEARFLALETMRLAELLEVQQHEAERMEEQWAAEQRTTREKLKRAMEASKADHERYRHTQDRLKASITVLELELEQRRASPTRSALSSSFAAAEKVYDRPRSYGALRDNTENASRIRPGARAPLPRRPSGEQRDASAVPRRPRLDDAPGD